MRKTLLAAFCLLAAAQMAVSNPADIDPGAALARSAQEPSEIAGKLVVFHAGSLAVPLKKISDAFMKEHPKVTVLLEAAGSRDCARKIADLKRPCDVLASADYVVIDELLIPEHADWNIKFASNEMAIVYQDSSRGSDRINRDNWFEVLMEEGIRFGRSDPNADPCGYRAIMTMKLAEKYYNKPKLAEKMLKKDTRYVRPKAVDLLALLETHTIDYFFEYTSVAQQHGLKCLLLPDEVNLKKPELADLYRTVSVDVTGKKPGEVTAQKGAPMVYGVTIPKSSPNPEAALAFVQFLLDKDKGMAVMERSGQPSVVPSPTATYDKLPTSLRKYAERTPSR
ncbi:MAG: tungstate ABC transporter substrate-binding protein WtpA [Candidatus Coatesbacteria bacterium]|nr:tungstate ABC transporter substrate-binding protein WtpA [Candidatus Coatesbacteria bacterium]